ncbi:MAG: hypothetical protein L0K86_28775 [Actinomycetia bacterium]|nr:hypothetical protein [Actinomycetes bacterium]
MDGRPEGTQPGTGRSRPRWLVLLVLAFAVYLSVRLVEGVVWLIGLL